MKLFLCPNGFTGEQAEQAAECISALEKYGGHKCALSFTDSHRLTDDDRYARFSPAESDMIVSLGGDGSVLRAAQTAIIYEKPLIGINSGRLGYLCVMNLFEAVRFNELLPKCVCSKRSLLEFTYDSDTHYALNDVVIAKKNFGETVDLSVCIDDEDVIRVRGDGLIIATPTGSTAYNLSSGGPMLDPDTPSIVLTPICPHASHAHPIVLGDKRTVTVKERDKFAQVYADGSHIGSLFSDVTVRRSRRTLSLYSRQSPFGNMI